ncbi:MAG: hypothetical protein CM15mP68_2580 [Pseudomonadota bacterium]|nr:MAG: hypothetical protein CM15mP68_2580 [Pseudomonadota bacterium]
MTTDTVAKLVSRRVTLSTGDVVITGMAKGSGMIKPDMATMLAFVACNAKVAPHLMPVLTKSLRIEVLIASALMAIRQLTTVLCWQPRA